MITVAIIINGHPLMARSAYRIKEPYMKGDSAEYRVDDGTTILHNPEQGAVELAKKLLETIKEEKTMEKK